MTTMISEAKLQISAINARTTKEKLVILHLTIDISDNQQLSKIINKFRSMKDVIEVRRVIS